jgi:hypothetical protein
MQASHRATKCHSTGRRRGPIRGRQHAEERHRKRLRGLAGSENLARMRALRTGTGRSPVRPFAPAEGSGPYREGEEPKPMMHGPEKSDPAILGMKPANKPGRTGAESVDRRTGAKENASETHAGRTLGRETASSSLERVRERARQDQKVKFTALLHHVDVELLRKSFLALKRKAAPGVDGVTWHDYEQDLETKLVDLHGRVHRGAYRAQPSRRRLIPKEDGRQ